MNKASAVQQAKTASYVSPVQGLLQRQCACGNHTVAGGVCAECAKNKSGLQRKLSIGASNDPLEQEADRVADQVMAAPVNSAVSGAPPRIQRYAGQTTEGSDTAPASVDRVLAGSGKPLEPALQQDMGQRFGYDFSQVRVHSGSAAEQSARDVNANAYTAGHNIVFGAGRFAPGSHEGRRLIAHELTHVVQQGGGNPTIQRAPGAGVITSKTVAEPRTSRTTIATGEEVDLIYSLGSTSWATTGGTLTYVSGDPGPLVRFTAPSTAQLVTVTAGSTTILFTVTEPWTVEDLKNMLDTCDGGLGIRAKAKKANKNKDPKIVLGAGDWTNMLTGEITLNKTQNKCNAVQVLIQELSNLSRKADFDKLDSSALAGDVSREDYIKQTEQIEYESGVKNVLTAFDACKDIWKCNTAEKEWARKAKDFEDYFKNFLNAKHKEGYGQSWDDNCKAAYDKKHAKK